MIPTKVCLIFNLNKSDISCRHGNKSVLDWMYDEKWIPLLNISSSKQLALSNQRPLSKRNPHDNKFMPYVLLLGSIVH